MLEVACAIVLSATAVPNAELVILPTPLPGLDSIPFAGSNTRITGFLFVDEPYGVSGFSGDLITTGSVAPITTITNVQTIAPFTPGSPTISGADILGLSGSTADAAALAIQPRGLFPLFSFDAGVDAGGPTGGFPSLIFTYQGSVDVITSDGTITYALNPVGGQAQLGRAVGDFSFVPAPGAAAPLLGAFAFTARRRR